jgi:uncharacterized protein (DUF2141 family)
VTDDNECVFVSGDYVIEEPELDLTAAASVVSEPLCNGDLNGEIQAHPTGGNGGYSYQWDDPASQNTQIADGIDAGFYNVTVTDRKSCQTTASVTLTQPQALSVTDTIINHLNCFNVPAGSVNITVAGGTAASGYSYNWSSTDGSGQVVDAEDQSNIAAGTYNVTIQDDNGCELNESYTVTEPTEIVITDTVNNDITTCYGDNTGAIVITATGGTGQLTYTLYPGAIESTNGIFTALTAGNYAVHVSDENGCGPTISDSINISEPTAIIIEETSIIHVSCNDSSDASIDISVSGGTGAYTYTWSTLDGTGLVADTEDQTELTSGTYNITVEDGNQCEAAKAIIITEPEAIVIDSVKVVDASASDASDGTITVYADGGTGNLEYTLTPGDVINETGFYENLAPGEYSVSITDENMCGPVISNTITVGSANAIDDLNLDENIKIYPNPTSSKLTVEINLTDLSNVKIEVLNSAGGIVENRFVFIRDNIKEEFDLSGYSKGIYLIKLSSDQVNYVNKIVLQ